MKNNTLTFEELLTQKKMSFTHSQSYQLRTAMFIQGVLFASGLLQQLRKPHHTQKISILLRRPARLKPDNFSKSKPDPGPNPTRKIRTRPTALWS